MPASTPPHPDEPPTPVTAALVEQLYRDLRAMAGRHFAHGRGAGTLQPTALVHEAFLRLLRGDANWNNKAHFLGAAAQAMRRIVVEAARRRAMRRRHGEVPGLDGSAGLDECDRALDLGAAPEDLLTLDAALDALKAEQPRAAEVVTLRYFAGLGEEQIAAVLGITTRTVRRDWHLARIALARTFGAGGGPVHD